MSIIVICCPQRTRLCSTSKSLQIVLGCSGSFRLVLVCLLSLASDLSVFHIINNLTWKYTTINFLLDLITPWCNCFYKVCDSLFVLYITQEELVVLKERYYKVGKVLQSEASYIFKWGRYYKVKQYYRVEHCNSYI